MLPIINCGYAIEHIICLHRPLREEELGRTLLKEINTKLLSGEVVLNDLARGDTIRVKAYPEDPDKWNWNTNLFFVEIDRLLCPEYEVGDEGYGTTPKGFFWPEFSLDYWVHTVVYHSCPLVPVRMKLAYPGLSSKDIVIKSLPYNRIIAYIETPELLIVYPNIRQELPSKSVIIEEILNASHVFVVVPGANSLMPWYGEIENPHDVFNVEKPIIVISPSS